MANKYCNLVGTNKIKDEYTKINTGFDRVEADVNKLETDVTAVNTRVDTIITTPISGAAATQEIVDARVSAVKSKTFATLDARFEETEQDITTHKADNAAHGGIYHKNLLHNWDFRNPVNQRGQSSYSGVTYTIDRWQQKASSDVTTVNVGSVTFGKSTNVGPFIIQVVENLSALAGRQVTFSVKILAIEGVVRLRFLKTDYSNEAESGNINSTGIFSFTHTITSETIGVAIVATTAGAKVTLESAKLELGPVSTLANDPPADFGEELRKCQRYLFNAIDAPASGVGAALGTGIALSETEIRILLPIPAHMRPIAATVILSSPSHFQCVGASTLNISALAHGTTSSNSVMLIATVTGATPGQSYYLRRATGATDGRLLISKEL